MDALLHVGLGNAVLASALAVFAAGVGRLGRRPALAHALWLLVLLKLLTPPLWRFPLPWPTADEPPLAVPAVPDTEGPSPSRAVAPLNDPKQGAECPAARANRIDVAPPAEDVLPGAEPCGPPWREVTLGVWLAGCLGWWGLAAVRLAKFARLTRGLTPAPAGVQERARELAGRLGLRRCPAVCLVAAPLSPMLLALGRAPRVLLPAALWQRLGPTQRDTLLFHELAHLRRGDQWVRRLELLVLGLYWWLPVAWWACRALQSAEEECCDAWVVWALPEAAPDYAAALVETVTFLSGARSALPAGASGAGHVPLLKRRLVMILRGRTPRRLSGAGLCAVLGLGVLLLPLLPGRARTQPAPPRASEDASRKTVAQHDSCQACHARPNQPAKKEPADWMRTHNEVIRLMDEVAAQRKRLAQAEDRLKVALKRLELFQKHGKEPSAKPAGSEQRLKELEKKLDTLHKEIESLRRELRPKRSAAPPLPGGRAEVVYLGTRRIRIPFQVGPERLDRIRAIELYVSSDLGRSWRLSDRCTPDKGGFEFSSKADGHYWFTVAVGNEAGVRTPSDPTRAPVGLRVCVDTKPPEVTIDAAPRQSGKRGFNWRVRDDNLDPSTLRVEHRPQGATAWQRLEVEVPPGKDTELAGRQVWDPATNGPYEVRVRARDRAGNEGVATAKVPAS